MTGPEQKVVDATVRVLDAAGIPHWNVGAHNGETGLPDRMAVLSGGRLLAMEMKAPGTGRLRPKQAWWLGRLSRAGAIALVVTDAQQVIDVLEQHDAQHDRDEAACK